MGFAETMIFYHLIGVGVAAAVFLSDAGRGALSLGFRVASAVVFWPLYLPILLARPSRRVSRDPALPAGDRDEMAEAIARVEAELEAALSSLDGWAEGVMAIEADRIRELRAAWTAQAGRIREMDRLLACEGSTKPGSPGTEAGSAGASGIESSERCRRSEGARRSNLDRLRRVRHQAHEDLMGTLAWVRELVSMIHLAKFTGAPASRAEELVAQIASAVKGMSAVTWQDAFPGEGG
jgi:hypothetical protein